MLWPKNRVEADNKSTYNIAKINLRTKIIPKLWIEIINKLLLSLQNWSSRRLIWFSQHHRFVHSLPHLVPTPSTTSINKLWTWTLVPWSVVGPGCASRTGSWTLPAPGPSPRSPLETPGWRPNNACWGWPWLGWIVYSLIFVGDAASETWGWRRGACLGEPFRG